MMDVDDRPRPARGPAKPPTRPADSEKITINLGHVDLGHIDLLVAEGVFSNRSDFIRTAIPTRSSGTPS